MIKGKFRQSALNFETSAFQFKHPIEDIRNRDIILDFSSLTFVNPFGLLFLKYLLTTLSRQNKVKIIFKSSDVINYLVRMSFCSDFRKNQNIIFNPNLHGIHLKSRDLSTKLIELHNYSVNNDDEVERITETIIEIVAPKVPFFDDISDSFQTAITETISNTQVHSMSNIVSLCLQTYGHSVIMALGDAGIGIKAGLKGVAEGLNDEDAIEKALEPLVSGRTGGGGMGLTELIEKIKIRNDCMGIRSRGGYIYAENYFIRKGKCAALPGTQLMIRLNRC